MIANNPSVKSMKSVPSWVPDPVYCEITELRLKSSSCDAATCQDAVKIQVITARILMLMIEAELHLGSAMEKYVEAMGL
jgi:hypothetical protein